MVPTYCAKGFTAYQEKTAKQNQVNALVTGEEKGVNTGRPGGVVPFSRLYPHTPLCVEGLGYREGKRDTPLFSVASLCFHRGFFVLNGVFEGLAILGFEP